MSEPAEPGLFDGEEAEEPEGGAASQERRRVREYRITGLADLLPDWLLPPEGKQHVRAARREN